MFEHANAHEQLALTLFFPVIKHVFRRLVHAVTAQFPDDAEQEAVSGIEICATMYQSIIMQNTLSPLTTALLLSTDVLLGLFSVFVLMKAESPGVPQHEILSRARTMLRGRDGHKLTEDELVAFSTVRRLPRLASIVPHVSQRFTGRLFRSRRAVVAVAVPSSLPLQRQATKALSSDPLTIDKKTLTHALELVQFAETVVLTEYIEVFIPLVNALYVAYASRFAAAVYNPKLRAYHVDTTTLLAALTSLLLFASLQALSVLVLEAAMWHRYRVSALTLLAFVLERHAWSLQGKLVTWLTLNFQFPVAHYGVDFNFAFDFARNVTVGRDS